MDKKSKQILRDVKRIEDLPNEILREILKHLNSINSFYSFDGLNNRFNELIRSTNLYFNFKNVSLLAFEDFLKRTQNEPSIKSRIVSIFLSDIQSVGETDRFLSNYSIDEFSQLKHLFLENPSNENAEKFFKTLPATPHVSHFCLKLSDFDQQFFRLDGPSAISKLRRLQIPKLPSTIQSPERELWLLEHLTISRLNFEQIRNIFAYCPNLKTMDINFFSSNYEYENIKSIRKTCFAHNLRKLNITSCRTNFQTVSQFLQLTPNLTHLCLSFENAPTVIDAKQWQNLISSSLKHLIDFEFKFLLRLRYDPEIDVDLIKLKFKEFCNDFWTKQHHWNTRCEISRDLILIQTISHPEKTFKFNSFIETYHSQSMDSKINFDRVEHLLVEFSVVNDPSPYYFPNVKQVQLLNDSIPDRLEQKQLLTIEHFQRLTQYFSLSKIRELYFSTDFQFESPSVLIEILNKGTNIHKLGISLPLFRVLSTVNEQFSMLIKEKIKSLTLLADDNRSSFLSKQILFDEFYPVTEFCEKYPHIEELFTNLCPPSQILTLLDHLPKFSLFRGAIPLFDLYFSEEIADEWAQELIPALLNDYHIGEEHIRYHYQSAFIDVSVRRTFNLR